MVCVCYAFELTKTELHIKCAKSTDTASQIFWNWLLKHVKLSEKHAALHSVYADDAKAVFFDLNDDGTNEIIGTHYATSTTGGGDCLLYILQKDNDKYKKISSEIYFDPQINIYALRQKTNGWRNIQVYPSTKNKNIIYVFNPHKRLYERKSD